MPVCFDRKCKMGPNGGRFTGDSKEVEDHEVNAHGKRPKPPAADCQNTPWRQGYIVVKNMSTEADIRGAEISRRLLQIKAGKSDKNFSASAIMKAKRKARQSEVAKDWYRRNKT